MTVESEHRPGPPAHVRAVGRAINAAVVRAPWAWPLLRRPVQRYFGRLAAAWDERSGAGSVAHLWPLARAVTRVEPRPERVLDIGTGTGEGALFLAREYPQASVRGVDISEEMIRIAQRKVGLDPEGRVAFRVADAAELPFAEGSFDLVAQVNMPPFFAECARVLRPGGHVIVAASSGPTTPFYTPAAVLQRGFARHGVQEIASEEDDAGAWWVGRIGGG